MHISKLDIEDFDPLNLKNLQKGDLVWVGPMQDETFKSYIVRRILFDGERVDVICTRTGKLFSAKASWLFKFKEKK